MAMELTQEQSKLINSIAKNEGFLNYEIEANSGSIKGDNYLGVITTVAIKEKNSPKSLDLILKSSQSNENLREKAPIDKIYVREIEMYEHVFPELLSFQKELGILNPFNLYAKYYGSFKVEPDECLVLKNLKENGYKLWNRKLPMNPEHISLVFSGYAKFHAVSFAYKELQPEQFRKLTNTFSKNVFEDLMDGPVIFKKPFEDAYIAVGDNEKLKNALDVFSRNAKKFFFEDLKVEEDQLILMHGDSWCNNMMFKYEDIKDMNRPTTVCFLDWQLARLASPVLDLAYFFFAMSPKEVLYDVDKYLKLYHNTLSETLVEHGCDPKKVFPYSLLETHWKKYAKYGLYVALTVIKIMISDSDEVPDIEKAADSGDSLVESFDYSSKHMHIYNKRVSDIVEFFVDKKLV